MFKIFKSKFEKLHLKIDGNNNFYDKDYLIKNKIKCRIIGNNNSIILPKNCSIANITIEIYGDNNNITIGENSYLNYRSIIKIGLSRKNQTTNCRLNIGDNTGTEGTEFVLLEPNTEVLIGSDCMFACNTKIFASGTHSLLDENGYLLNYGKFIHIGNHCWLGWNCKILKNVSLADNTIVGMDSIVTKSFDDANLAIAGIPAKIIRRNVNWEGTLPGEYAKLHPELCKL